MGWYGTNNSTLKSTIAELTQNEEQTRTLEDGSIHKWTRETLAHCFRGNIMFKGTLWSVIRIKTFNNDVLQSESVFIHCDLMEYAKRHEGWLYKPLDEGSGPCVHNCPLKYLKMAPVINQEWRDGVVEYHNFKKQKRQQKQARDLCKSQPFYVRC